jgi:glycosyltransferase involved in cell wall biosynthesis/GR25 family glycosyltransferase involved in LPS biosynthesis
MNGSFSKKAFENLVAGNYAEALDLYAKLKLELNSNAFDYNIKKCQGMLSEIGGSIEITQQYCASKIKVAEAKIDKSEKRTSGLKICLIRIIGNDLPGLHSQQQTIENLKFILEHEPECPGVDKVFLLNRIVSDHRRQELKDLIRSYGKKFFETVFKKEEYLDVPFYDGDLPADQKWTNKALTNWERSCWEVSRRKLKNSYLMNNNGARNYALEYGKKRDYDWVLPWDGNCFLSEDQFSNLQKTIEEAGERKDYIIVPMERCLENNPDLPNRVTQNAVEEPQIAFRKTAKLNFDSSRVYGNQPKVELLKRLGVPGMWDDWTKESPWGEILVHQDETQKEKWVEVTSVFRLASGNVDAAVSSKNRSHARADAIIKFCDDVYEFSASAKANKSKVDYLYFSATHPEVGQDSGPNVPINSYFDNIYLVSLKHEKEKRYKVSANLKKMGVLFEYFEAVNGYEGKSLDWFEKYKKTRVGDLKHFHEHNDYEKSRKMKLIESPGAVGYLHTYISILKDAREKKYKRILILEDDVLFSSEFSRRFSEFVRNVGKDWKILMLGASQYGWNKIDFETSLGQRHYTPRIHDTKGSFAIAFDNSVYDEVIINQEYMEAPFDNLPLGKVYEKYPAQCFVAFPYLVMPDVAKSTIRETRSQYNHANRVKWWVGDFQYPQRRITIGLLLNSSQNAKYLDGFWKKELSYNLALYIEGVNGLVPLHNLSQLTTDYQAKDILGHATNCNLSVDILLNAPKNLAITQEMLESDLDSIYRGEASTCYLSPVTGYEPKIRKGRVSVVVPTYKRSSHLRAAIKSVLEQDYNDIEVLIVDDNGKFSEFDKETEEVINLIRADFKQRNIKYLKHETNANGASARNTGILASTGEYICFLDDDDIYLPGRISKSVVGIENCTNKVGGIYCGFFGWNSSELDPNRFTVGDLTKEILMLDYDKHYLHTNTATYRRQAIFDINGFDPSYRRHQDLEFNLRFFSKYKIDAIKECLVHLAPEKSAVDNKVYGMEMYELKEKFLSDFAAVISGFELPDRQRIYRKHWLEVAKYGKKSSSFLEDLEKIYDNGALQVKLMLG